MDAFGPTNVRIHRVSVAAELGDPAEALRAAADVDPTRLTPTRMTECLQQSPRADLLGFGLGTGATQTRRRGDAASARSGTLRAGSDSVLHKGRRAGAGDAGSGTPTEQRSA